MKLHNIAFYFSAFFMAGIALASLNVTVWATLFLTVIISAIILYKKERALAALVFAVLAGFSYFYFHAAVKVENIPFGEIETYRGVVSGHPESRLKSQKLNIELQPPYGGEVAVYTDLYPVYEYGDLIEFTGTINKSPSGRINISLPRSIALISHDHGNKVKQFIFSIRDRLVENLQAALPSHQAALMSGILLGERAEFTDEFKEAMKASGTTHIVALSGFNISIIGMLVSNMLSSFMSRRRSFYVTLVFIILFVLMTGAEASVVRAAIMGIIMLLAAQTSRIYNFRNAITLTAFLMLLLDPTLLVFDVGFQLSFTALLGIIYLEPVFKKYSPLKKEPGFLSWRDNLRQTTAAQLAVLPIVLTTFGSFNPLSLIANVLILEFIPATMLFGFLTSVAGLISFNLSLVFSLPTGALLAYETFIINLFSFNWL